MRFCLIFLLPTVLLSNSASFELNGDLKSVNKKLIKTLKKLNLNYVSLEKTEGFAMKYDSGFLSQFPYSLYLTQYTPNKALIRINSPLGQAQSIRDAFLQDHTNAKFMKVYGNKSWLLADSLTLISPSFGIAYTNFDSPFHSNPIWNTLLHLGIEGLLIWMGGKTFWTHKFDPFNQGLISTSILLTLHRIIMLPSVHTDAWLQGSMVSAGYTFRY